MRPPYKTYRGTFNYYPMKIGDHVHIGANSVVEAATIGNHVEIGKNCVIGKFTIIKDCAQVADNTVVPANTVIPALALFGGSPAFWVYRVLISYHQRVSLKTFPSRHKEIVETYTKQASLEWLPQQFMLTFRR
ncbi:hypothetical protein MPER_15195 [Moniliophthora perniciosa FA553]|nr:hypothetical protein MPER_15195 [Moniliophthora perniciosa FA553]